jgi:penicillin-binding protein 2
VPSQRYGTVPDPAWLQRKHKRRWETYDTVNMSIGQGYLLVNPLQLAVMAGRIASGLAIEPRLVRTKGKPNPGPVNMTAEHLAFVRDAMSGVVNSGRGTASVAKLPLDNVLLAGKTGTAQVRRITMGERASGVRSNASLAWKMRDHSLFVGFAPADNPRYSCAVIVEHGGWGATVAAPIARDTLLYLFDPAKAMAALVPIEEQLGGTLAERMARRAARTDTPPPKEESDDPDAEAPPPPVDAAA